jgi:hypothetical protein
MDYAYAIKIGYCAAFSRKAKGEKGKRQKVKREKGKKAFAYARDSTYVDD